MSVQLSRGEFLVDAALSAAGLALAACNAPQTPNIPTPPGAPKAPTGPTAAPTSIIQAQYTKESFRLLSAKDRILMLESNVKPQLTETDNNAEMVRAVADYIDTKGPCRFKPEEMATRVNFVTADEMVKRLEKNHNKKYTEQEATEIKEQNVEVMTGDDDDTILMNTELFDKAVEEIPPDILKQIVPRDKRMVFLRNILFHAFSHMNMYPQKIDFDGFSMTIKGAGGTTQRASFSSATKFVFEDSTNPAQRFRLLGVNEALAETNAVFLTASLYNSSPPYFSPNEGYAIGAKAINYLCAKAGITPQEFTKFMSWNPKGPLEFAKKIGAVKNKTMPDIKAAMSSLFAVGLGVNGIIEPQEIIRYIDQLLDPKRSENAYDQKVFIQPKQARPRAYTMYPLERFSRRDVFSGLRRNPSWEAIRSAITFEARQATANSRVIFQG